MYRELLEHLPDDLLVESVPKRGVSTETLRERLSSVVSKTETVLDRCRTDGRTFTPTVDSAASDDAYRRWRTVVESVAGIYDET